MICEATIYKHNIYSLTKSIKKNDGTVLFLGKSMEGYFIVVAKDELGKESEVVIFSSYSKARSSIGIPTRMIPVFKKENVVEIRCECCGQVLKR